MRIALLFSSELSFRLARFLLEPLFLIGSQQVTRVFSRGISVRRRWHVIGTRPGFSRHRTGRDNWSTPHIRFRRWEQGVEAMVGICQSRSGVRRMDITVKRVIVREARVFSLFRMALLERRAGSAKHSGDLGRPDVSTVP